MPNPIEKHKTKLKALQSDFLSWNQKLNLSAIRDQQGVWEKHIQDSLLPLQYWQPSGRLLDLGSGGGFPILPLAITCSQAQCQALDSVGKKMKAVQSMADHLEIPLQTHHGRIEDFAHDRNFREKFTWVTARALAPWPVLLEYCLPFVTPGGHFLAYQGPKIHEELDLSNKLIDQLGGEIEAIKTTSLGDAQRIFVLIKKIKPTSKNFPRANGLPRKEPLVY